jgi:hypothetical protein
MSASLTRYKELLKSQFDELWPTEMKESMALGQVR